jgi:hypothetical protein
VDNPDMFLTATQGMDRPVFATLVALAWMTPGRVWLSTGAQLPDGAVENFRSRAGLARQPTIATSKSCAYSIVLYMFILSQPSRRPSLPQLIHMVLPVDEMLCNLDNPFIQRAYCIISFKTLF